MKITACLVFILCISCVLDACPVNPNIVNTINIDGREIHVRMWGDEFANGYETLDGFTIIKSKGIWYYAEQNEDGNLKPSSYILGSDDPISCKIENHLRPSKKYITKMRSMIKDNVNRQENVAKSKYEGDWNVPVLLIDFPDNPHTYSREEFQDLLFSENPDNPRSMTDYYNEVSYGKFHIVGDVFGWYTAKYNKDYYGYLEEDGVIKWNPEIENLVIESINAAIEDPDMDFSKYDNKHDNLIDSVNVFFAGASSTEAGGIWSHSASMRFSIDNLYFVSYTIQSELVHGEMTSIGVFTHEFAHTLGLVDLYDIYYSSNGIGDFGLMGTGSKNSAFGRSGDCPAHMCAWSKIRLGWIDPLITDVPGYQQIQSSAIYPQCIRINGNMPEHEYFLVENRQKMKFDRDLPGESGGMLIWHIDDSRYMNHDPDNRVVDLEQAQKLQTLDLQYEDPEYSSGDNNDYFREGKEFSKYTDPNSKSDYGIDSGISIIDFNKDKNLNYKFYVGLKNNSFEKLRFQTGMPVYSNPVVTEDNSVYLNSKDGYFYHFDNNGNRKWRTYSGFKYGTNFVIAPDKTIYLVKSDNYLYSLFPSGLVKWKHELNGLIMNRPALAPDGTIYVYTNKNSVFSVNPDGTTKWELNTEKCIGSLTPDVNGRVYFSFAGSSSIYAMNSRGEVGWNVNFDLERITLSNKVSSDGTIYAVGSDDVIYALNRDGSNKWSYEINYDFISKLTIKEDGSVYFVVFDSLCALNPDGTLKWIKKYRALELESYPVFGPDNNIYVSGNKGYVHIFDSEGNWEKCHYFRKWSIGAPVVGPDLAIYVIDSEFYLLKSREINLIDLALHVNPVKDIYVSGDNVDLILDIHTPSYDTRCDIYFIMLDNDNEMFFGNDWGMTTRAMVKNFYLPLDQEFINYVLMNMTFPEFSPPVKDPGIYTFAIAAAETDTLNIISNVALTTINLE